CLLCRLNELVQFVEKIDDDVEAHQARKANEPGLQKAAKQEPVDQQHQRILMLRKYPSWLGRPHIVVGRRRPRAMPWLVANDVLPHVRVANAGLATGEAVVA